MRHMLIPAYLLIFWGLAGHASRPHVASSSKLDGKDVAASEWTHRQSGTTLGGAEKRSYGSSIGALASLLFSLENSAATFQVAQSVHAQVPLFGRQPCSAEIPSLGRRISMKASDEGSAKITISQYASRKGAVAETMEDIKQVEGIVSTAHRGRRQVTTSLLAALVLMGAPQKVSAQISFFDDTSEDEQEELEKSREASDEIEKELAGLSADERAEIKGYAAEAPANEKKLKESLAATEAERAKVSRELLPKLEKARGPMLGPASRAGRWVQPWLGGWQLVWTSETNKSFLGGTFKPNFAIGNNKFKEVSVRQFLYGPGDGGFLVEYLHQNENKDAGEVKVLFAKAGNVNNLGANALEIDFGMDMQEFLVRELDDGTDKLVSENAIPGGAELASKRYGMKLKSTYLSSNVWILRDFEDRNKISIFCRTKTKATVDRRGLVADGQLKPPDDETIKFGRLLFGDTLSDYQNWDKQALKRQKELANLGIGGGGAQAKDKN